MRIILFFTLLLSFSTSFAADEDYTLFSELRRFGRDMGEQFPHMYMITRLPPCSGIADAALKTSCNSCVSRVHAASGSNSIGTHLNEIKSLAEEVVQMMDEGSIPASKWSEAEAKLDEIKGHLESCSQAGNSVKSACSRLNGIGISDQYRDGEYYHHGCGTKLAEIARYKTARNARTSAASASTGSSGSTPGAPETGSQNNSNEGGTNTSEPDGT